MNTAVILEPEQELMLLCGKVRGLITNRDYNECFQVICQAMSLFPDAPQPHNLLGILCEKRGNHASAMRHFRAAYELDPGYLPALKNLETYGTFFSGGKSVYGDENAVRAEGKNNNTGRILE